MTRGVFVEAAPVVAWTAIGVFLQGVYLLTSIGLNITKRTGYYPVATIAAAIANVALNFALIPRYGMMGAACANAAAYAVQAGLAFAFSQRVYPVRYEYGRLARATGAAAVAFVAGAAVPALPAWAGLIVRSLVVIAVFAGLLWISHFFKREELQILARLRPGRAPVSAGAGHDRACRRDCRGRPSGARRPVGPCWLPPPPEMTSIAALVERHPARVIVAIALLFAAAYASSLVLRPKPDGRIVIGDALHHYVQLRSAVFDRDLHFRNEYVQMYRLKGGEFGTDWIYEPTVTGHTRNLMPIGPAILWAPMFLLATAVVWVGHVVGLDYALDGYGRIFQATAGLSGIAAAAAGVWLSFLAAADLMGRRAAAWASIVLWLSSSAVYYSVISPTYSHAASLFATSLFWYAFSRTRNQEHLGRYTILGALAGVAALMRWQDAIVLAVPCVDLAWRLARGMPAAHVALRGLACVAAALLAFTPQIFVWQTLLRAAVRDSSGRRVHAVGQPRPGSGPLLGQPWSVHVDARHRGCGGGTGLRLAPRPARLLGGGRVSGHLVVRQRLGG